MIRNQGVTTSPSTSKSSSSIVDSEFGVIVCRRNPQARSVRLRVTEHGELRASLPKRAPLYLVSELLEANRVSIRKLIAEQLAKRVVYQSGMAIGRSHRLELEYADVLVPNCRVRGQTIAVTVPNGYQNSPEDTQRFVSQHVRRALRREAVAYLPRRLRYLADYFGFQYERERFGNQKGRWASCSSSGTISLNVALMNLPLELIDYVLVHELAHTRQMNHSQSFWGLVEACMPDYKLHRKTLKTMSPIC